MGLRDISFKWVETLVHLDLSHNNLLVILLLPAAPRLRFMDLTGNRIGGLIMHERIEYRMLGNPVESAVLYFDRRRMLDWWNELIAPQSMQIEGPKNVPPIIFAEDEFAASCTRQSKRFRIDSKEYQQSAIVGTSEAMMTRPNHWNFS